MWITVSSDAQVCKKENILNIHPQKKNRSTNSAHLESRPKMSKNTITLKAIIAWDCSWSLLASRYFRLRIDPRNLGSSNVVGKTIESIFSEYHDGSPPMNTYPFV